jgi:hypothetical protein
VHARPDGYTLLLPSTTNAINATLYENLRLNFTLDIAPFLEANLERLLSKAMRQDLNSRDRRNLFEFEGAVGTFSSKIIVAYALRLIGPTTRGDLDLSRFLRNEFAHSRIRFGF